MKAEPGKHLLGSHAVRAGILAFIWDRGTAGFTEVATALEVPNNTLSSHLTKLESAGYLELQRGFFNRKPRTQIVITPAGREAWSSYLETLSEADDIVAEQCIRTT